MNARQDRLPHPPARPADLDDDFSSGSPDLTMWISAYLPHWTTPDRSSARYDGVEEGLQLRMDEDRPEWRPEDAPLRVSHLQTAVFSGAYGSRRGMHRHRLDGLTVRTPTPTALLFAPSQGRVDVTVSATRDSGCMVAAWLVGVEHRSPDEAGETCIFEIDAHAISTTNTRARVGIKAHHDPRLVTDMAELSVPIDAVRPHTWTTVWGEGETLIGCDGVVLRRIEQAPDYPLALMIDLFEVDPPGGSYPKSFTLHHVRGWAR